MSMSEFKDNEADDDVMIKDRGLDVGGSNQAAVERSRRRSLPERFEDSFTVVYLNLN
ncbi:hypothetical protein Hdeb2414_s0008g00263361 [Helianthus debilis subsp. tardiflorus]